MSDLLRKPHVYMAGKIAPYGWRDRLVNAPLGFAEGGAALAVDARGRKLAVYDPRHTVDAGPFVYVGPFFEDVGHGVYHGPTSHGSIFGAVLDLAETRKSRRDRQHVFNRNMGAIERADVVFAYLNETDCFGTLVELGSAHALGKPIFVCLGPDLSAHEKHELWFAQQTATRMLDPPVEMAFAELVFNLGNLGQFGGRA